MNLKAIPGYAAALWSAVFAALHFIWAAGWYVGLPEEITRQAFAKPWFLAFDLFVAGLCVVAALVAVALVEPWGRDRKSTRLNSSHIQKSRMPSSA